MTNTNQPLTHPAALPDVFIVVEEGYLAPRCYLRDDVPDSWITSLWNGSRWQFYDNVGDDTALAAFNDGIWPDKDLRP